MTRWVWVSDSSKSGRLLTTCERGDLFVARCPNYGRKLCSVNSSGSGSSYGRNE